MMIKVGITGGLGSGKSVVSEVMNLMGIPVYIADTASKELTTADPAIRKDLIALLGEEVYCGNQLNKKLLAAYLFSSPESVLQINSIIHPRVRENFRKWVESYKDETVVAIESAILFEAGFRNEVDVAIMVYAPLELRIERGMARDGVTRETVLERINRQMDDEVKKEQADFIIINDGETPLLSQIENIVNELKGGRYS